MAIPNKPIKFSSLDFDFGTTVAKALWVQARDMMEYANASYPLGMLLFTYASQANNPAIPDPRFWKFMDGTTIVNPNSPFDGIAFPDLRNRLMRPPNADAGEQIGYLIGRSTVDLSHDHTGITDWGSDLGSQDTNNSNDDNKAQPGSHRHSIFRSPLTYLTYPRARELQCYMRVVDKIDIGGTPLTGNGYVQPNMIDDSLIGEGDIASVELFAAIAEAINYLADSMPVGTIIPVMTGFNINVPVPETTMWQLCDGSTITNQNSPIRNQATPNLTVQCLLKGADSIGTAGQFNGSNLLDLSHNHSGVTGTITPASGVVDDDSFHARNSAIPHNHPIFSDLAPTDVQPISLMVAHYIKIL